MKTQPSSAEFCRDNWRDAPEGFRTQIRELFPVWILSASKIPSEEDCKDFLSFCIDEFSELIDQALDFPDMFLEEDENELRDSYAQEKMDKGSFVPVAV